MNQGQILMAYLRRNGRTSCQTLERVCDVRSVTTRMSELIRSGAPIEKAREVETNTRGQLRPVTYYALARNPAQGDLFAAE